MMEEEKALQIKTFRFAQTDSSRPVVQVQELQPLQRNNPGEYDHQTRTGLRYTCRGELCESTAPGES